MAINLKKICDESVANFGTKGCQTTIGELVKPILVSPTLKLDVLTDDLDQAAVDSLICNGLIKVLPEGTFTPNAEENVRAAQGNSGVQKPVRDGLFAGSFSFCDGGTCFSNALSTLKNKKWALWFIDADGKLYTNNVNGMISPFKASYVDKGTTAFNDGSTFTQYTMDFQFSKAGNKAWNTSLEIIETDVDWLELDGVNDVTLEVSVVAGDVVIDAVLGCDGSTKVPNQETNFAVTDVATGTVTNPTATYDASGEVYTIAGLASANYTVDLRNVADSCNVTKDAEGCYYASSTASFTV